MPHKHKHKKKHHKHHRRRHRHKKKSNVLSLKQHLKGKPLDDQKKMVKPEENKAVSGDGGQGKEEAKPEVVKFSAGEGGVITSEVEVSGKTLKEGTYIEVVSDLGDKVKVKAYSGYGGKEFTVDKTVIKKQPRLARDKKTGTPHSHEYKLYEGDREEGKKYDGGLFTGDKNKPKIEDIDQGALGDCYLIAAMGAVVALRPDIIEKMVEYDDSKKIYRVYFYDPSKNFERVTIEVDAYLPTRQGTNKRTAYAMSDRNFDPKNTALWPAIVEKAYAKWKGGYDKIVGGSSARAMSEITGVRSVSHVMPKPEDAVALFKKFKDEKKAVTAGTKDYLKRADEGGFRGSGEGPYEAVLKGGSSSQGAEIVKGTLRIVDQGKQVAQARDDGKGKIVGSDVKEGHVTYEGGRVSLTYKGKQPKKAEDLKASYNYEGLLSESLNIHGNHAYIFQDVRDDKIIFHNPWGPASYKHPKPLTGADFVKYFETIGVNSPPKLRR